MIRTLRRRFIISAMAAFLILFVLLVCSVAVIGCVHEDRLLDEFLVSELQGGQAPAREPKTRAPGGERRQRASGLNFGQERGIGCYIVSFEGDMASVSEKGMWEPDFEAAEAYARQALSEPRTQGKIGGYHYMLKAEADSVRVVLADNSMRLHMYSDMLGTVSLVCLACLAALFIILLPVSRLLVRSYAENMKKQKQFITNAGHEIKTPVAIIMSNVDAMELIQGENKWSRNIRGQTERLNVLLQRLLFMARADERSVMLPSETVELNSLLEAEAETYSEIIHERGLKLELNLGGEIRLRGSHEYLRQLAHILLDNAVQYSDAGGSISVRLEQKRRWVRLSVANSVERLPDCPPEALFERFYRGDSARTQSGGGYGIGLSAACAIAEMHRGRIGAEYRGENSICFTVELPLRL